MDEDEDVVAINYSEVTDSVAFSLVEDLARTKKVYWSNCLVTVIDI
jgi:hypothetical protein